MIFNLTIMKLQFKFQFNIRRIDHTYKGVFMHKKMNTVSHVKLKQCFFTFSLTVALVEGFYSHCYTAFCTRRNYDSYASQLKEEKFSVLYKIENYYCCCLEGQIWAAENQIKFSSFKSKTEILSIHWSFQINRQILFSSKCQIVINDNTCLNNWKQLMVWATKHQKSD